MAPTNTARCSQCESDVKDNSPAISCSVCISWFHKGCSGLTSKEFNKQATMWKKSSITTWICDLCQDSNSTHSDGKVRHPRDRLSIGPGTVNITPRNLTQQSEDIHHVHDSPHNGQVSLNDIMDKLIKMESQYSILLMKYEDQIKINMELRAEIADMKQRFETNVGTPNVDSGTVINESIHELNQRQIRQRNLMIFGMKEETLPKGVSRNEIDTTSATNIILKVFPQAQLDSIKVFRVGRESSTKNRPMKVILDSPRDVANIIRHASELKKVDTYRGITLSYDRTPKQIEEYKNMKATMSLRLQNGESNLKIKYIGGIPRIVKMNNHLN